MTQIRGSLKLVVAVLGTLFFGILAIFLGVTATAAGSLPLLGALWVFTPAPVIFIWLWWSKGRTINSRTRIAATAYLSTVAVVSLLVIVGVSWIGSERGIHPPICGAGYKSLADYPLLESQAELVSFPVPGLGRRVGWFIPGRSESTIILLHGFSCHRHEMLDHALVLNEAGYSTLLFDFYGRGDSDGDASTLGYYERRDALAAVEYLNHRSDVDMSNVGVLGVSLGASVAIMAAAEAPEIKAVVADSPFETAGRAIEEGFTRVTGLPCFPYSTVTLGGGTH
jgi:uncharacterized protein